MNDSESENEKMAAVATLLSHYWIGIENVSLRRRLLGDWLNDLDRFSAHNVTTACEQWRRTEHRRPVPADIVALCREAQPQYEPAIRYINPPVPSPDLVREHWRKLHIRDWTHAELQTANGEALYFARQRGYDAGDDRQDRLDYFKAALGRKHEGYDATNGCEKWLHVISMN